MTLWAWAAESAAMLHTHTYAHVCTHTHTQTHDTRAHTQWNECDFTFSVLNCLDSFNGLNGSWRMGKRGERKEDRKREKMTESEREDGVQRKEEEKENEVKAETCSVQTRENIFAVRVAVACWGGSKRLKVVKQTLVGKQCRQNARWSKNPTGSHET